MRAWLMFAAHAAVVGALAMAAQAATRNPPPTAAAAAPSESDWRTPDPANVLVIDTTRGRIFVELSPEVAPKAVDQVRALARAGFYDGRGFFRVIDGFMDQTGDPGDTGQGGSSKPDLPAEFTLRRDGATPMVVVDREGGREQGFIGVLPVVSQPLSQAEITADHKVAAWASYCAGVVGMARTADNVNSGNSQFFLMRDAQTGLDHDYTAIGRVVAGEDVVRQIKTGEPPPPPMDKMDKVRLLADIPAAERPSLKVIDTRGPWFTAEVARVRAAKLIGVSVCDLDIPSQVK